MPSENVPKPTTVQGKVKSYYGERITENKGCCDPHVATGRVGTLEIPTYGCGTPTDFAALQTGETVLDLGSGAGLDCFRAAEAVGATGRVIGVDMTPAMLGRARQNAQTLGHTNVEFREGYIEALPVEAASVDVILSNCVINLSADKTAVLLEAFRVLKPGGRLALSDVVRVGDAPAQVTDEGWCACEDGAETVMQYARRLAEAGFTAVSFGGSAPETGTYSARIRATKPVIREASVTDRTDRGTVEALPEQARLPTAGLDAAVLLVLEENGLTGFEPYGDLALLRSLAVVPERRGAGLARALLIAVFARLQAQGVRTVYALTTTIPDMLVNLGFTSIRRDELPAVLASSAQLEGPHACPSSAHVFYKAVS